MANRPSLPPGPFLVVGLARSGVAVAEVLAARGEWVTGCDTGPVDADLRARLEGAGVSVHEGVDGVALLDGVETVVKSPGVPAEAPVVAAARGRGVPVVGELEIGWRLVTNDVLAVTGSNGKTTTTELLAAIHRAAGTSAVAAGNVGTPLSSLAAALEWDAVVVCEASSFQLEDSELFAPDAAVLLNLAPDHLDRHGSFANYRAAKERIFANQPREAIAVLPAGLADEIRGGNAWRVTFGGPGADLVLEDGELSWLGNPVMPVGELRLRGAHNLENAMAAATVALARGLAPEAVREALGAFAGVEHRLEEVGETDGVIFVNDSKATNVASAVVGIASFPAGVHVILGGSGKGEDYAPLVPAVAAHCRAAYLIGEQAGAIGAALAGSGVPLRDCEDLERAVAEARSAAQPGDVVLLSPACASFDQYRSYEERGAHFRALVAT